MSSTPITMLAPASTPLKICAETHVRSSCSTIMFAWGLTITVPGTPPPPRSPYTMYTGDAATTTNRRHRMLFCSTTAPPGLKRFCMPSGATLLLRLMRLTTSAGSASSQHASRQNRRNRPTSPLPLALHLAKCCPTPCVLANATTPLATTSPRGSSTR